MSDEVMLKPTSDRKTRFYASQRNTYGLLPGNKGTCVGCTTKPGGCWYLAPGRKTHTCYVDSLLRIYKGIHGVLEHNTKALREAGTVEAMKKILDAEFTRFEQAEEKRGKKLGNSEKRLLYRLHWSGDVFNETYAEALRLSMTDHPNIQFWTYTRNFAVVPTLVRTPNLILYLSLDPVNVVDGLVTYAVNHGPVNPNLQFCYMNRENDFEQCKQAACNALRADNPDYDTKWLETTTLRVCPVDAGNLEMIEGCAQCRRCITPGTAPVWFKS